MKKVIVVGGGAAGMMAAYTAAGQGHEVTLLEQNEKLGKKIYITGKGRCNLTNDCYVEDLFKQILRNPKFLYSAIYEFDNFQVQQLFEELGCKLKVERAQRVFPVSDHASDVIFALERGMKDKGVQICLNSKVTNIMKKESGFQVYYKQQPGAKEHMMMSDAVIISTGGLSYPTTGSTGDGYQFAKLFGHTLKETSPSLVPFNTKESFVKELMGLSLKNVEVSIYDEHNKKLYSDFGEMLFTHFGVSGPLILSASAKVNDAMKKGPLKMLINLKPALTKEQLDKRILREFDENKNRQFKNAISGLFPGKLTPVMVQLSGIDPDILVNEVTKEMREQFVELIQAMPFTLTGFRDYNEAIVTKGGIHVKEINPSTMESKLVKGLFFAGEILDCDAYTGGFNLQIAWSTGHLAGSHI